MNQPSTQVLRKLTAEELADIRNARGFQVPWQRLAEHYGMPVEELQRQLAKSEQAELDLFSDELLDGIL